ncbi:MAG: RHS repeat-associated core domain-containing protein [Leptospiraceae bacterium]|nr:RHS repeat-associated core domain-containing protein [Leptospiraceae bacterium]
MITNTSGEVVAGTSIGSGKSIISYTPYGEIDRDHSGGPDIYRYKYTGQEEDRETGLYYYKARYYDPKIGRFLQPDTVLQTSSPFGTNQYMYVEGNPVMYNDPSGHWKLSHITKGQWALNLRNGINRLTYGRHYRSHGKPWRTLSNKIGQFGTWGRKFIMDGPYRAGFLDATGDYIQSLFENAFSGRPAPYLTYHNGGFMVHNSVRAKNGAYVGNGFGHVDKNTPKAVLKHERGHMKQFHMKSLPPNIGGHDHGIKQREYHADIISGTMDYSFTPYIYRTILGREGFEALNLYNLYYLDANEAGKILLRLDSAYNPDSYDIPTLNSDRMYLMNAFILLDMAN